MSTLDYNVFHHIRQDEMQKTRFPSTHFHDLASKASISFSAF